MNRRYFFFGSLAWAASCGRRGQNGRLSAPQFVSIVKMASYSADLAGVMRRLLVEHRVPIAGKRIVLKPNMVEFNPRAPINTNPHFVAAALEAFEALGAAKVTIAEGPGHRRTTLDMAEAAGFFEAIQKFENRFVDLNLDDVRRILLPAARSKLKELYLPQTVLDCDLLVSLPKMKTHHWTGATLAMKNLFGLVPGAVYGWPKNILHWSGIHQCIADLHALFPRQFCLVDGIEAMEGNGPILGSPKTMNLLVAGSHPPSVDATCCQLMRIDPDKIGYLTMAAEAEGWNWKSVRQIGERIEPVAQRFALHPDLANLRLK